MASISFDHQAAGNTFTEIEGNTAPLTKFLVVVLTLSVVQVTPAVATRPNDLQRDVDRITG
jgi:hypothetical protein